MRIAIFDYKVIASNPSGNCHLTLLRSLAREHQFTVFSAEFENPDPAAITWVRVPVPVRPLALLFAAFHAVAPVCYFWHKLTRRKRFDIVQSVESNLLFGSVVYSHFSHTTFLRRHSQPASGLRGILRSLDHWLHAHMEAVRYPAARLIVTPSAGLAEELETDPRVSPGKIRVIANPIAIRNLEQPQDFAREQFRKQLGFNSEDIVLTFAALGQFERKGLPQVLEALALLGDSPLKLLVIGGEPDVIADYQQRALQHGLEGRVRFAGMQSDVRPYLWSGDAFILPSSYETFSLVTYEAAAASLPILAPPLNGIRDLLRDGENGFLITREASSIRSALERLVGMSPQARSLMGETARRDASAFSVERFVEAWRTLYTQVEASLSNNSVPLATPLQQSRPS